MCCWASLTTETAHLDNARPEKPLVVAPGRISRRMAQSLPGLFTHTHPLLIYLIIIHTRPHMYDLMKKHSQSKPQEQQHIPIKLFNLLDEGIRREEEYVKLIETLRRQNQTQAKEYTSRLEEFSKLLEDFKNASKEEPESKTFKSFEMRKQEEAQRQPKRTLKKKEYTTEDWGRFALEIQLKFLCFCPILDDYLSSFYPKKLQVKFDVAGLQYDSGRLGYGHSEEEIRQLLKNGYPLALESGTTSKQACFAVSLQVKQKMTPHKLQQVMSFMKKGTLEIEVWDSESRILFGLCYLSLESLLHYDKSEDFWVQSVDVFSPLRNQIVGKLDIELRNYKSPLVQNQHISEKDRLKVVSTNPLEPTLDYDIRSTEERERRMLRRINHFKEDSIKLGKSVFMNFEFDYMQSEKNQRRLEHVMKHKEENKFAHSEEIFSRIQAQHQYYECNLGTPLVVPLEFTNVGEEPSSYQVHLSEVAVQTRSLSLVINHDEFQFYKRQHKFQGHSPSIDPRDQTFQLNPGQTILLLMKYLTWEFLPERPIQIRIEDQNSHSQQSFSFRVKSIPEVADHKFRIYEKAGVVTQLTIPFPEINNYPQPHIHSVNSQMTYSWGRDSFSLQIKVEKEERVSIFLYDNKQMRKLIKCHELLIYPFTLCDFRNIDIGFQKTVQLQIPPVKDSADVRIYSSNQQILWSNTKSMKVKADTVGFVTVTGRTFSEREESVILSCNKVSGQILHQWLFKVKGAKPAFKKVLQVIASTKKKVVYQLQIENPTNKNQVLGLVSSNLGYVQIVENKKVLNSRERAHIPLSVMPHSAQSRQVVVNVSNFGQSLNLNYLLEITFTDKFREEKHSKDEIQYRRY